MKLVLAVSVFLGLTGSAWAQATRTWVSGVGDDANPCSRTAPCKTFAGAISKTAAGGEIDALDPGGFGAVTITKALTLDGRGTFASILVAGTNGIIVAAGATDVVTIRGLNINGINQSALSGGLNGIRVLTAAAVHVEDCTIFGMTQNGIDFEPTAPTSPAPLLFVKNTVLSDNTVGNLFVNVGNVVIEKSQIFDSAGYGLLAAGTAKVTVHDSTFTGHAGIGIHATGTSEVNFEHGLVAHNGIGIQGDSTVRISEVMVSDNGNGVSGTVASFGNNRVAAGNTTNGAPSTVIPQQ